VVAKRQTLLTRTEFREGVFARDGGKCVFCGAPAVDAHHIIDRRLWPDEGYYLDNGASVCADDHWQCEWTTITVEQVRAACGIEKPILPPHLYAGQTYDKWGNPVLPNGQRLRGELFFDGSVQKVLGEGGVLGSFTHLVKYPRTHHLPWSPGMTDDDRTMPTLANLIGQPLVITEKMDGENTTMYSDHFHARSVDGRHHPSRDWAKNFWASIRHDIPEGWRICGENLYAQHSIAYDDLPSYFLGFSIWNELNECLPYKETLEWFALLDIRPVPPLWMGVAHDELDLKFACKKAWPAELENGHEGYVVRTAAGFPAAAFRTHVGKYVRANHVQTVKHWMHGQPIVPNKLADR
jgi:hypothetical protein